MKIRLSAAWREHHPRDVIDLDDRTALALINDGVAHRADEDTKPVRTKKAPAADVPAVTEPDADTPAP